MIVIVLGIHKQGIPPLTKIEITITYFYKVLCLENTQLLQQLHFYFTSFLFAELSPPTILSTHHNYRTYVVFRYRNKFGVISLPFKFAMDNTF